jgi:hypothetical protein
MEGVELAVIRIDTLNKALSSVHDLRAAVKELGTLVRDWNCPHCGRRVLVAPCPTPGDEATQTTAAGTPPTRTETTP